MRKVQLGTSSLGKSTLSAASKYRDRESEAAVASAEEELLRYVKSINFFLLGWLLVWASSTYKKTISDKHIIFGAKEQHWTLLDTDDAHY